MALNASRLPINQSVTYPRTDTAVSPTGRVSQFTINAPAVLSASLAAVNHEIALTIIEFEDDALFPSESTRNAQTSARVSSSVIEASLGVTVRDLLDRDRICGTFEYRINLDRDPSWNGAIMAYNASRYPSFASPKCVFYNHSLHDWSQVGCTTTLANATHAKCCCNHLTPFAVLVSGDPVHIEGLLEIEQLTWITIGMAIGLHSMTAVVIVRSQQIRVIAGSFILFHMSLALIMSESLIFFAIGQSSVSACQSVSALLMYAFLVAFSWMLADAYYRLKGFNPRRGQFGRDTDRHGCTKTCVAAWGIPAVVVAGTLSDLDGIITPARVWVNGQVVAESINACWPTSSSAAMWFFLGPAIVHLALVSASAVPFCQRVFSSGGSKSTATAVHMTVTISNLTWMCLVVIFFGTGGVVAQSAFAVISLFQAAIVLSNVLLLSGLSRRHARHNHKQKPRPQQPERQFIVTERICTEVILPTASKCHLKQGPMVSSSASGSLANVSTHRGILLDTIEANGLNSLRKSCTILDTSVPPISEDEQGSIAESLVGESLSHSSVVITKLDDVDYLNIAQAPPRRGTVIDVAVPLCPTLDSASMADSGAAAGEYILCPADEVDEERCGEFSDVYVTFDDHSNPPMHDLISNVLDSCHRDTDI
eukprot:m.476439 g.476439  ORF g.476439 m.476439 type:complete len:651 (+) comp40871_c0_seq1:1-1953(+)